ASARRASRRQRCKAGALRLTMWVFFFFQAEDGIRGRNVTGVQTCALPIYSVTRSGARHAKISAETTSDSTGSRRVQGYLQRGSEIGRASCRDTVRHWAGGALVSGRWHRVGPPRARGRAQRRMAARVAPSPV